MSNHAKNSTILIPFNQEKPAVKAQTAKQDISFFTADNSGGTVTLQGIAGMPYNNSGTGTIGSVQSIQDILSLTEQEQVCVTNNGNSSKFFWNPQKIYDRDGTQRNISKLVNTLSANNMCIN